MSIQLTQDQQDAYAAIITLVTTNQQTLVIEGGAGVGKTTLMNTFMDEWPQFVSLSGGAFKDIEVVLTATTNKAADALANATKRECVTIHSLLGLRVQNIGYGRTKIMDTGKSGLADQVVVIDEASFIDKELLAYIQNKLRNCKVIFLGDPNQLKPVGSDVTPVFNAGYPTVTLNQIVRQSDDSPIQALSRGLRSLVEGAPMPSAGVDGVNIIHMPQKDFEAAFVQDVLNNPVNSVRALAWTNKRAIYFNEIVSLARNGSPEIQIGDVVNVNKQHRINRNFRFATDSTFQVIGLGQWRVDQSGIESREVQTSFGVSVWQPRNMTDVLGAAKRMYDTDQHTKGDWIMEHYADLRLMYASTVNKAQGSTYDTVYIDLNDIGGCRDKDQVNRMLYVAVSRARNKVVFTGDI
ncbi:DNA helicase [Acinetobacter phage nACB1]|nr:DNA helicase [Acinetobacter phage nACB1]